MKRIAGSLIGALLLSAIAGGAHATTIAVATDGSWNEFDVDSSASGNVKWIDNFIGAPQHTGDLSPLSFTFTLATQGLLKVVDAGFAGDTFEVFNGSTSLGMTSAVPVTALENNPPNAGTDFDAAFADHTNFSYASILLAAGTYTITGALTQSMTLDGAPLESTAGGISVAPVPLPAAAWLLVSGLLGFAKFGRRRALMA